MSKGTYPYSCENNGKEIMENGEKLQLFCNGKFHIWTNLRTNREFVLRDRDNRIILCPDYVNRQNGIRIDKEYEDKPIAKEQTFETFEGFKDEILKIKNFIISEYKILFLIGIEGVGKTHLAYALQKEIIESKKAVEFITAPDLQNIFLEMRTLNEDVSQRIRSQEKYNKLKSCNLLIVDDLGRRERITNYFQDQLCELIDKHFEYGKIMITTNKAIKDNKAFEILLKMKIDGSGYLNIIFDRRIISRLVNTKTEIIKLIGKDRR